ncbi:hypothetical protein F6X51_08235 [Methylobacterium planeticum]|uniref:Uncharacterized protein n=1 Tax=Methylobacterium planeticum TaxID=2615211 RepID=A0A6N6MST7_9HYPH|nr:hypothetical protein F6X51_08235 [Methylobacterium planeticum]
MRNGDPERRDADGAPHLSRPGEVECAARAPGEGCDPSGQGASLTPTLSRTGEGARRAARADHGTTHHSGRARARGGSGPQPRHGARPCSGLEEELLYLPCSVGRFVQVPEEKRRKPSIALGGRSTT